MCSEYQIAANTKSIERALGYPVSNATGETSWEKIVKFSVAAPVLERGTDGIELVERVFPVSPFPNSRLSGFEHQSDGKDDDATEAGTRQIRRIYEVPRWKKGFAATPCLIPMTSFTEFAYWGKEEGSALAFQLPEEPLFFAAGIRIRPFMPKTGKENGFAILTHTATKQMLNYHQRLIVLLSAKHASEYLDEMTAEERFQFLIKNRYTGELAVQKIRNMAKGWEKRAPQQRAKLAREESYRNALETEGVRG